MKLKTTFDSEDDLLSLRQAGLVLSAFKELWDPIGTTCWRDSVFHRLPEGLGGLRGAGGWREAGLGFFKTSWRSQDY